MTIYSAALLAALLVALRIGKPGPMTWVMMLANFAASRLVDFDPEYVAAADIATAAVLAVFGRSRTVVVAAIFLIMAMLEVIAHRLSAQNGIIYIGTELLAYLQCGVIGGADRGIRNTRRPIRGRWAYRAYRPAAQSPGGSSAGLARSVEANGRG